MLLYKDGGSAMICFQNWYAYSKLLPASNTVRVNTVITVTIYKIIFNGIIGASLSEPHHVRSTVKFVFLLACLYACHRLIWLSTNQKYIKSHLSVNHAC